MMHRRVDIVRFASRAVFCGSVVFAACAPPATRASGVSVQPAAADSIAAQLAELELQRIAVHASREDSSTTTIDSQLQNLRDRLQLRADSSSRQVVMGRVLLALDARRSSVNAGLAHARLMYTDRYPPVARAIAEIRLIDRRRNEIRAGGF